MSQGGRGKRLLKGALPSCLPFLSHGMHRHSPLWDLSPEPTSVYKHTVDLSLGEFSEEVSMVQHRMAWVCLALHPISAGLRSLQCTPAPLQAVLSVHINSEGASGLETLALFARVDTVAQSQPPPHLKPEIPEALSSANWARRPTSCEKPSVLGCHKMGSPGNQPQLAVGNRSPHHFPTRFHRTSYSSTRPSSYGSLDSHASLPKATS